MIVFISGKMYSNIMTSIAVYLYINNVSTNVCELNRKQSFELNHALLATLKPLNKNCYLELDLETNDEYAILTCTDTHDKPCNLPPDVTARINKYIAVTTNEWKTGNLKILLSMLS
jgi:hypothetical protein